MPSRCRVPREAASSQTRRCQVAEEMRAPPSKRARTARGEDGPLTRPAEHLAGVYVRVLPHLTSYFYNWPVRIWPICRPGSCAGPTSDYWHIPRHRFLVGLCLELRLANSPPTKDCTAAMGYGMTTEEQANPVQIPAGSCSSRRSRFRFVSRPGGRQFSLLLAVRMDDCVC
jgi:hypothetical protein